MPVIISGSIALKDPLRAKICAYSDDVIHIIGYKVRFGDKSMAFLFFDLRIKLFNHDDKKLLTSQTKNLML